MTFVLDGPTYQHDSGKEKQSGGGVEDLPNVARQVDRGDGIEENGH